MLRLRRMENATISMGTRVLMRIDANVQVNRGRVDEEARNRLEAVAPTIRALLKKRAVITLIAHCGEPKGKERSLSLRPIAKILGDYIGTEITFVSAKPGSAAFLRALARAHTGKIFLLENLRYSPGEKANDPMFAENLAAGQDIYINEAFASSHRPHASIIGVTAYLRSYAGMLCQKEVAALSRVLHPKKPLVVILGGAKISSKIEILASLLPKAKYVIVGGGIANCFLAARGFALGVSAPEEKDVAIAEKILKENPKKILLPHDVGILRGKNNPGVVDVENIPNDANVFDVGTASVTEYTKHLEDAATIIWNGPIGMFEKAPFDRGTMAMVKVLKHCATNGVYIVAGGGETVMAIRRARATKSFGHVSTGGGAMLDFLAKGTLVGLEPLIIR